MPENENAIPAPHTTLRARTLGWLSVQALRMASATWSKHHEGLEILDDLSANDQPHIMTFWHRKFITLFPLLHGWPMCVATAASPPGDVIANMCDRFGYDRVQIPDHGRNHSLNLMEDAFSKAHEGSVAVDGPHGPYHAVKPGAIQAASDLGFLIVPITAAPRRKFVMSHRWDQLEIPGLFTRASLVVGEPMTIPPNISREDIPVWAKRLHDVLEELDDQAERKAFEK